MGICTRRHFLLSVCILQLIFTVIRQVFDFLGYMWVPILVNFFEIIFIIFGFFGAFQYQPKYVLSYSIWNIILLAWNLFLACLYLDIGILDHQDSKVLKLDQLSASWWQTNGPGCKATVTLTDSGLPKPDNITDCLFNYVHVEVFQAALQCFLAFLGCVTGICLGTAYLEKDDSFEFLDGSCGNPRHLVMHPLYVSESNLSLNAPQSRQPLIFKPVSESGPVFPPACDSYSDDEEVTSKIYKPNTAMPYGHAPMSRHLLRAKEKNKMALYADRIRVSNQDVRASLSLSYDRLNFGDTPVNTDPSDVKIRPRSMYIQ